MKEVTLENSVVCRLQEKLENSDDSMEVTEAIVRDGISSAYDSWNPSDHMPIRIQSEDTEYEYTVRASPKDSYTLPSVGDTMEIDCLFYVRDNIDNKGWIVDGDSDFMSYYIKSLEDPDSLKIDRREYEIIGEKIPATREERYLTKPDSSIEVESIRLTQNMVVQRLQGLTAEDEEFIIRERSGVLRVKVDGEEIFHAMIGREFPGMTLSWEEIYDIVDTLDYIELPDKSTVDAS